MKFSIVVPVYNVEKYINKCLSSVLNQTYDDYEVIIVNDGSTDSSQEIITKYVESDIRFHSYEKQNGGLSDARNYGLKYVTGDYILFLDSDDYLSEGLLNQLNIMLEKESVDLLRFSFQKVDEEGNVLEKVISDDFSDYSMDDAIISILGKNCVEPAWCYAYNKDFFFKNHFSYPIGYYHEDYGLTPLILLSSKCITSTSYIGLNYVQRQGSIMNSESRSKSIKKMEDTLALFKSLRDKIENSNTSKESKCRVLDFMVRVLMDKLVILEDEDYYKYVKEAKELHLGKYLYPKNFKGHLKKVLSIVNWNMYCKLFLKKGR